MKNWQIAVIDPPWEKKKGGIRSIRPKQNRKFSYKTLPITKIFNILDKEIFPFAEKIYNVFL